MPERDVHAAIAPLIDALVERSEVHAVCLWERDGTGFRRIRCQGASTAAPGRFMPDADLESWIASGGAMSWRVTDRRVWEGPEGEPDGRFHLALSVAGLLLEVTSGAEFSDAGIEAVLELVEAFGDIVGERRGRAVPGAADADPGVLRFVDLTFVESVAMGDRDFVVEILAMSEASFRSGWDTIRTDLDSGRLAGACAEAHKLRSTARTVGASRLDDELLELERAPDLESARTEAGSVGPAVEAVVREIRRLLDRMR